MATARVKTVAVLGACARGRRVALAHAREGAEVHIFDSAPLGEHPSDLATLSRVVQLRYARLHRDAGFSIKERAPLLNAMLAEYERCRQLLLQQVRQQCEAAGWTYVKALEIQGDFDQTVDCRPPMASRLPGCEVESPSIHLRDRLPTATLPNTMIVVGAGPSGATWASLYSLFGIEVTWLVDGFGLLPKLPRSVASSFGDIVMERGVKIVHDKAALSVATDASAVLVKLEGGRTYSAEEAIVCVGRVACEPQTDFRGVSRLLTEPEIAYWTDGTSKPPTRVEHHLLQDEIEFLGAGAGLRRSAAGFAIESFVGPARQSLYAIGPEAERFVARRL